MAYDSSPVFRSPSYWIALAAGVAGVVGAAMQERRKDGSRSHVRGTGLAGDPKIARLLLVVEVDPDMDDEDREELWDVVSTGSLPVLTTSEDADIDNNTWMVVASRGTTRGIQEELDTLLSVLKNMSGVVSMRRITDKAK